MHHHEESEGVFAVNDEGVRPVESSVEVLHFQKCAPLREMYNEGCVDQCSKQSSRVSSQVLK